MNIVEQLKRMLPALALMALCSAAILYLPEWNRDADVPRNISSTPEQKTPPAPQDRDKQA